MMTGLHHHHRQIDTEQGQVGAKQLIQNQIRRHIHDRGRIGIHHRTEAVAGQVTDGHRQHAGCGEQQDGRDAEHHRTVAVAGHGDNGRQTQPAHHHGVIQPEVVIVDVLVEFGFRLGAGHLCRLFLLRLAGLCLLRLRGSLGLGPGGGFSRSDRFLFDLLAVLAGRRSPACLLKHFGRESGE